MDGAAVAGEVLAQVVARRVEFLTGYQDAAYAERYRAFVDEVRAAESAKTGTTALTEAVARYYFKLLAYKDEYEVARLYTATGFAERVATMFEGDYKLAFHLSPPAFARVDPRTGEARKSRYGPWMWHAMKVLARLRFLRGGVLDPFGRTAERRTERALIAEYERTIRGLLERLAPANVALATEISAIPEEIRGYGHVKLRTLAAAKVKQTELLSRYHRNVAAEVAA